MAGAEILSKLSFSTGFNTTKIRPSRKVTTLGPALNLSSPSLVRKIRASAQPQVATDVDTFHQSQQRLLNLVKESPDLKQVAATKLQELTEELVNGMEEASLDASPDPFEKIKKRFLTFKQKKFLKKPDIFSKLAAGQSPKFMVVACADSRVCPSHILGFEPGEAFIIRNVANLVPSWKEKGLPSTSAALEYAVLALKVENILVIGHSCCGGIKALMSDEPMSSDFIESWLEIGKPARIRVKSAAAHLPFEDQCTQCEKESVNQSLSNLLTYPWIKDLVSQEKLFLHGGYYNFVDGSFEQWSLSPKEGKIGTANQWC